MSYGQFGYTYPTSSQLLMTGQHPTATYCDPAPTAMTADSHPGQPSTLCSLPSAYESRLLSTYPRLATGLAVNGLYSSTYADQAGYMASFGSNPAALYSSSLAAAYDLKDARPAWAPLSQAATACYPYDPPLTAYNPYGDRFDPVDSAARRRNATRETTNTLKAWLNEHRKNPYPTKGEKIMLAIITKMTLTQVSTWFANARRRLKKENKMTWEPKNKSNDPTDDYDKGNDLSANEDDEDDEKDKKEDEEDDLGRLCENEKGAVDKQKVEQRSEDDQALHRARDYGPVRSPVPNGSSSDFRKGALIGESDSPEDTTRTLLSSGQSPSHSSKLSVEGTRSVDAVCSSDRDTMSGKPKIWSLAHTATSESPPLLRRSPFQTQSPTSKPSHYGAFFSDRAPSSSSGTFRGNPSDIRLHDSSADSSLSPPTQWPNDETPGVENGPADVSCGSGVLDLNARSSHVTIPLTHSPVSSPTFGYRMLSLGQKASPYPKTENSPPCQVAFGSHSLSLKSPPPLIRYSADCTSMSSPELLSRPKMDHRERGAISESRDHPLHRPAVPDRLTAIGLGSTAFRPVARSEASSV